MKAIFAGSFDPITNGHLDIIKRSAKIFDKLYVGVLNNPNKSGLFSFEERKNLIIESTKELDNIEVISFDGLLVNFCKENDIKVLVRSIRNGQDIDYEIQMASMNKELDENIETIILTTNPRYGFVSSSLVKEVVRFGGDVKNLVPEVVLNELNKKINL